MINEVEEFQCYTGPVEYTAAGKKDVAWMRRFTFDMLEHFEGFGRVLTIIARGYMFDGKTPDIDRARRALLAWCSIPDNKKASPREGWQFRCCFPEYNAEFPELVDAEGRGWLYRHVHSTISFVRANPSITSVHAQKHVETLAGTFDAAWRSKVVQLQVPIFSSADNAWLLNLDGILADALELGPLRDTEISFTDEELSRISAVTPPGVPVETVQTLIAYYYANKPTDSDWVVLPVTNFDAYLGTTSFSRKWLTALDGRVIQRDAQSFGVCRVKIVIQLADSNNGSAGSTINARLL